MSLYHIGEVLISQNFVLQYLEMKNSGSRIEKRWCGVKQITSPGWMHETSAQTWCTGKTWREWVEMEVGGGIRMGNTCKPMAVSFQCITKFTTNKKIK